MVNDVSLNRQFLDTGDIDAFSLLFKKYYPVVYAHVDGMMRNHPDPAVDADDITSKTFTRAFNKRKEIREPEKLLGWLLTTARNLTIDEIRNSDRRAKYLSVESLDSLSVSERQGPFASFLVGTDTEQAKANQYLVRQLVQLLQDKDREIVELMLDGLKPREIANTIGSTSGAVQKRWERLIKWLKPIALHLDALVNCLPEEKDRKIMERYLDGQLLSEIAKAMDLSRSAVDQTVKRVIKQWKKAAEENPTDPVSWYFTEHS